MSETERIPSILNAYRGEIMARSPRSLAIWQQNHTVMPGGVGSLFRLADPFPFVVRRAKGARIWDADDNEYLDCMLGFSTLILGNAPDEVEAAIREALPHGAHYGQYHEREYVFAKLSCDMVPGVDKETFCNSGTEATLYALRLARASTGRPLIAKFEGGHHGTHDLLAVSFGRPHRGPDRSGPVEDPAAIPESPGLAEGAWKDTIVLPYNHPAAFDKIMRHASQLAGVIVEPVLGAGGTIPADREFLSELRRITQQIGALLIFDEVITGFRLAPGGAQELYGVIPDVSTYGKAPGGGLPFGAVGGTAEAMRLLEYDVDLERSILVAGTFNGNPLTVAAGTAVLRRLSRNPALRSAECDGRPIPDRGQPLCSGRRLPGRCHRRRLHVGRARRSRTGQERPGPARGEPCRRCRPGAAVPQEWAAHLAQPWLHEHGTHRRGLHRVDPDLRKRDGRAEGAGRVVIPGSIAG